MAAISSLLAQIWQSKSPQVTNGGCPTYDKDVAHLICLKANRVAAFFCFGSPFETPIS
jgi:hypothetical protein